jgi:hypothetical protein
MKCGAKTRNGGSCTQPAMPNGRCRMHRGGAKKGVEHPNFKHGLYAKSLPLRLAARYDAALADPDLLGMRRETALMASLLDDALARLDSGETGTLWMELGKAWAAVQAARASGDKDKLRNALADVGVLIERGASDAAAAREIRGVILDKARVAESERKRLVEAHQVITVERLMALVGALSSAILEEVPDRERRARILGRFERLLDAGGPGDPR